MKPSALVCDHQRDKASDRESESTGTDILLCLCPPMRSVITNQKSETDTMNEPAYALIALTRELSYRVGTLSLDDDDFITERNHLCQITCAARLLSESAYQEADDLEENSVRLSEETQNDLRFLLHHGYSGWDATVADLIAKEAARIREEIAANIKPEPTPEEKLEWAREVRERLAGLTEQWVSDAETAVQAANQDSTEPSTGEAA